MIVVYSRLSDIHNKARAIKVLMAQNEIEITNPYHETSWKLY